MSTLIKEGSAYLAASLCALLADISILWVLVSVFSFGPMIASGISFLAGSVVAYELSVKWAFTRSRLRDRHVERAGFVLIGAIGLALNVAIIFFVVKFLRWHYIAAKCIAAGCTFSFNFIVRRQILFLRVSG